MFNFVFAPVVVCAAVEKNPLKGGSVCRSSQSKDVKGTEE
jgi:hypothetical protein